MVGDLQALLWHQCLLCCREHQVHPVWGEGGEDELRVGVLSWPANSYSLEGAALEEVHRQKGEVSTYTVTLGTRRAAGALGS
jgi:hypothetical protein